MEKNWESYDKPNYKRMMAEGIPEPVLISIDTSGSTEYLVSSSGRTYLDSYKKLANDILDEFSTASEFIIVNHNGQISVAYQGDDMMAAKNAVMEMRSYNGTANLEDLLAFINKIEKGMTNKFIFTDMNAKPKGEIFRKEGEGAGCGCPTTKKAEEPVVQEPDWIPDGDGRAIGQQDFAINLSPLHAEGMSNMNTDTVGNPSPTFNEDITGQDGPSSQPTNATFEAMMTYAPSSRDVDMARRDLKNSGYGDVVYDRYMVNRDGSSNKFYYTAVTEKDGKYYPMGSYGRIGYYSKLFNIMGKKENPRASTGSFEQAYRQCRAKEQAKIKRNYVDYTLQMAEEFRAYDDEISSRQEWMIKKLGGTPKKSMTRSDASDYIKELQGKESGTWQAETLAEIEGPTAEATEGGLHSPSSFAMTWENEVGTSSPSMPPNEIAWAEDVKGSEGFLTGSILAIGLATVGVLAAIKFGKKSDSSSGSDTKNAEKGCGCAKTPKKVVSVKESEYSVNQINPVEVEGQNDIYNAESIKLPSPYSGPQTAHRQNNRPVRNLW